MFGWIKAAYAFFAIVLQLLRMKQSAEDREAGAAAERSATNARAAENAREANEAEIEATKKHQSMPGDEAFDQDFRRRDP